MNEHIPSQVSIRAIKKALKPNTGNGPLSWVKKSEAGGPFPTAPGRTGKTESPGKGGGGVMIGVPTPAPSDSALSGCT